MSNHYCNRCHDLASDPKHYPCPGPDLCPLGIPHPANVEAVHESGQHKSFVLGCTACVGFTEAMDDDGSEDDYGVEFGGQNMFGYPDRDWHSFANGTELLAALGEAEVSDRLRKRGPESLANGGKEECSERLLLLEQDVRSPTPLVDAAGSSADSAGSSALVQRLEVLGLPSSGTPLQMAERLLLLRDHSVEQALSALEKISAESS